MSATKLPFRLIKPKSFDILRHLRNPQGFDENGIYTTLPPTTVPVLCLVSPKVQQDVVNILPEALRKRKMIRIFSNTQLIEHIDTGEYAADELNYAGESYRIFKLGDWIQVNNITYYEAYAVRIDTEELQRL